MTGEGNQRYLVTQAFLNSAYKAFGEWGWQCIRYIVWVEIDLLWMETARVIGPDG